MILSKLHDNLDRGCDSFAIFINVYTDLDIMLKHNKSYLGSVAHNEIKTIPTNKSSSQIINLHHSYKQRTK